MRALNWYKELEKGCNRNHTGFFTVEGQRAVEQIIATSSNAIDEILVSEEYSVEYVKNIAPVRRLSSRQIKSLCSQKSSQGIIAIVKVPPLSYSDILPDEPGNRILLLEHVQDPGNVGTLIRTAAAFNFSGVLLSDKSADPFSVKAVQASAGSLLSLWIRRSPEYMVCGNRLQTLGYPIIATSAKGTPKRTLDLDKFVIAVGNEGVGLSDQLLSRSDYVLRIPINDKNVESLNVAISGALIMYTAVS